VLRLRGGRPVVDLWGGFADSEATRPWNEDTITQVASRTKGATAICAHLLAQRGELDLDAPVVKYWPEFGAGGKDQIPVRWLLSHQVGLPLIDGPLTLEEAYAWDPVIRALEAQKPLWQPGTEHVYHAMTFGYLVGEVVRRISGKSLGTFFADEVAGPLGLQAWIGLPEAQEEKVARIEFAAPFTLEEMTEGILETTGLDADTVSDVGGIRLLEPATVERAIEVQTDKTRMNGLPPGLDLPADRSFYMSLGFWRSCPPQPMLGPKSFGHPGSGGSIGFADPDAGVGFGYVMNRWSFRIGEPRASSLADAVKACLG